MSSGVSLRIDVAGRTFDGAVIDTLLGRTVDGVIAAFDLDAAPGLEPGAEVALSIRSPALSSELALDGVLDEVWEEEGLRRFRFSCRMDGDGGEDDRRAAVRVAMADNAVPATVMGLDRSWKMRPIINDVSATGISFLVHSGEEFSDVESVVLIELDVPGEGVVEFGGRICYRRAAAPYDLYGVEFDARFTNEFSRKQLLMRLLVQEGERSGNALTF